MKKWKDYKKEKPRVGVEVLAYNHLWIDEDFNPKGVRIGFRMEDDFYSAFWEDSQESFVTIAYVYCPDYSPSTTIARNVVVPEKWYSLEDALKELDKES